MEGSPQNAKPRNFAASWQPRPDPRPVALDLRRARSLLPSRFLHACLATALPSRLSLLLCSGLLLLALANRKPLLLIILHLIRDLRPDTFVYDPRVTTEARCCENHVAFTVVNVTTVDC